jgi:hypothetical protein
MTRPGEKDPDRLEQCPGGGGRARVPSWLAGNPARTATLLKL